MTVGTDGSRTGNPPGNLEAGVRGNAGGNLQPAAKQWLKRRKVKSNVKASGRGEGTIMQRADGRWMARVDIGRGADGRRQRKAIYGATRAEVGRQLNGLLRRSSGGELLTTTTPTLKAWLNDWFATHRDDWRPGTQRIYRHAIDGWIVPALGLVRLDSLKPIAVQRWINHVTEDGARRMVTTAHIVLRSSLTWAMRQRLLTYNPAALVKVPRPTARRAAPLSADQAVKLLDAAESPPPRRARGREPDAGAARGRGLRLVVA